jgi:methyl-accepting chemotaxis protein
MEARKISWFKGIRTKVVGLIVITTTCVLGLSGYAAYQYTRTTKTAELERLAEVTADRLSSHLQVPMWDVDYDQVGKLLEAEMNERRIEGVVVRDEDKSTLFAARERQPGGSVSVSEGNLAGDYVFASRDVTREDKPIGSVNVFLTRAYLEQELQRFALGIAGVVVVLDLFMMIILGSVLGRLVVNPIKRLAGHAELITEGDLNRDIDVHSGDELGYLAATLNRMQISLRVAINRLSKR